MLTNPARTRADDERGYTVVELLVVMAIMSIVSVLIFSALASLTKTEQHAQAMVTNEQEVRFVVNDVLRDVRQANPMSSIAYASKSTYESRLQLVLGDTTKTYVRWVYDTDPSSSTYRTLRRDVVAADTESATVVSSTVRLRNVRNVEGSPAVGLFGYYSQSGKNLVTGPFTAMDVGDCAVRVKVTVLADADAHAAPFTVTADAHVRNRLPGGLGCG